jgi:hypothetical protein
MRLSKHEAPFFSNLLGREESSMPRQARLDSRGTLHHVLIRGIERRRIVDDEQDRKDFVLRLGNLANNAGTLKPATRALGERADAAGRKANDG